LRQPTECVVDAGIPGLGDRGADQIRAPVVRLSALLSTSRHAGHWERLVLVSDEGTS
jgi:hypothetical protein